MSRLNLIMTVFVFGLCNAMIRPMRAHVQEFGIIDSALSGFGISFIIWFAIYCSFDLLRKTDQNPASHADYAVAFVAMLLLCIPSASISWMVVALFAAYCGFYGYKRGSAGRNACLIILAVALRVPVSDICLKLSADALLQFDALATLSLLKALGIAMVRQGNILVGESGHQLLIMTGCASFTNISLALLLWFTVVRTRILRWHVGLTLYALPLMAVVMGVNIVRLSLMALSKDNYFFYHDGLGADIINALILLIALGIAALCIALENHKVREGTNDAS